MLNNNKILSENLNIEQERTLISLLNLIIPPSEDDKMPGAADVDFSTYIRNENLLSWIRDGLFSIVDESHNKFGREFSELSGSEQTQLIDSLKRRLFRFFSHLTTEIIKCYYQNNQVLKAIGLEARPPFPLGYQIAEGDLSLLEPVYKRGKIYRD